jgi:protein SCO1/2
MQSNRAHRTPVRHSRPLLVAWATLTTAGILAVMQPVAAKAAADDHAGHTMAAGTSHSMESYKLPDVRVTRNDGKRMTLAEALDDGRPVMLNFIYTSCNAICPVTSQVFVEVRERLGSDRDKINMVSISIDPEQDTPKRLTAYAKRFGSSGTWAHYTSSSADAIEIQRAFGAWRGDKMNHQATTWLRTAPGKPWQRYEGFTSPADLVAGYVQLAQGQGAENCIDPASASPSSLPAKAAATNPNSTTVGKLAGINARSKP